MVGVASSNLVVRLLVSLLVVYIMLFAGVAQLDRVPDYESGGCRFESRRSLEEAGVAELADAQDLKSCERKLSYRFDPGPRHNIIMSTLSSTG